MAHNLKRAEVARMLGKSTRTIRRWEGSKLSVVMGEDGEARYDEKEVERLIAESEGNTLPLETKDLQKRVEELERSVRKLQTRVSALERVNAMEHAVIEQKIRNAGLRMKL
jgi:uncharacterized protein YlxW (UPF0749 family)